MATLTNTQISVTYVGLLKTSANTVLSSTGQQITDGEGNNSILFLSTAGVGIGGAASSGKELDVTGNVLVTGDLQVDNINIDGNTITSTSADFTIDASADIILDAAGGNIDFKDNGLAVARFLNSTGSLVILAQGSDKDMLFKGNDGGSEITALTLDMSEGGNATFNGDITVSGGDITLGGTGRIQGIDTVSATTDAASKGYVDTQISGINTLAEILAGGNTTGGTDIAVSANDDITFADSSSSFYGASNDLKIRHNSTTNANEIASANSRQLQITQDNLYIGNEAATETLISAVANGAVELYHDNSKKLETTSTGAKVTGSNFNVFAASGATKLEFGQTNGNWKIEAGNSGNNTLIIGSISNATNNITLDTTNGGNTTFAGNVGIGVTPESWGTSGDTKALRISTMSSLSEAFDGTILASNFYFDGSNDKYIQSDFATQYLQIDGTHLFKVAASGTANNNITFTTALTIANNSNATFAGELTCNGDLLTVSGSHPELKLNDSDDSNHSLISYTDGDLLISTNHGNEAGAADTIRFANNGATERMRIDSSGNLGIATTSPSTFANFTNVTIQGGSSGSNLDFKNSSGTRVSAIVTTASNELIIETGTAQPMIFKTNDTERMRIDSSGNVLVGKTSGTSGNKIETDGRISAGAGSSGQPTFNCEGDTNTGINLPESDRIQFITGGSERMRVDASGVVKIEGSENTLLRLISTDANVFLELRDNNSSNGNFIGTIGNTMPFYTNNTLALTLDASQNATFAGTVTGTSFSATGGFLNGSNGGIRIHTSGTKFFNVTAANAARDGIMDIGASDARFKDLFLSGNITFGDGHLIGNDGDDNLLIQSSAAENIVIDSADDIILDADGADIKFKDGGTEFGKISKGGGSDLIIESSIADKDIFFAGTDGTTAITALTLDMSNGGSATFRDDIDVGGTALNFTKSDFSQIRFKESGAITIDYDNNQSSRNFQIKDGDGSSLLFVGDDKKVGIGTTSPAVPLHIAHNESVGLYTFGGFNHQAKFESADAEAAIIIQDSNSTNNGNRIGVITNDMTFITNDTEKMRIRSDGSINLATIKPIGHNLTNGTINNGASVTHNANTAGGNQAAGFLVVSAVPNNVTAGGAVGIFTHIHTQGANVYSQLSKREENSITISESGGVFTISNSSGSTVHYQIKTINMTDFDSTINGY